MRSAARRRERFVRETQLRRNRLGGPWIARHLERICHVEVELRKSGHRPAKFTVRQVRDRACFSEAMSMIGPAFFFIVPIVIAARAPWCSQLEQPAYQIELEPDPASR